MTCFFRAYLSGGVIAHLHTSDEPITFDAVLDGGVDRVVNGSLPIPYVSASDLLPIMEWSGEALVVAGLAVQHQAQEARSPASEFGPLTAAQWSYFLDVTGFRDTMNAALAALPKGTLTERETWAGIKAVAFDSGSYRLPVTLALVAQVRAMGLSGVSVPTDDDIRAAWPLAAAFAGAASLGVSA